MMAWPVAKPAESTGSLKAALLGIAEPRISFSLQYCRQRSRERVQAGLSEALPLRANQLLACASHNWFDETSVWQSCVWRGKPLHTYNNGLKPLNW
jgi:hypothetical protein